jgi:hypothetical protein
MKEAEEKGVAPHDTKAKVRGRAPGKTAPPTNEVIFLTDSGAPITEERRVPYRVAAEGAGRIRHKLDFDLSG